MGIKIALHHRSEYRYETPVALGPQVIQLRPTPHCRTPILSYSLQVAPTDRILNWSYDPHANHVARVLFPSKTAIFSVEVDLVADLTPQNPFAFLLEPGVETYPLEYSSALAADLEAYRAPGPSGPLLKALLQSIPRDRQNTVAFLAALNRRVREEVGYQVRMEHGIQSSEQTLALGTGSCRDSALLLVELCRGLGFAARFVSGYLIQLAEPERAVDGPAGFEGDSAALHAWAEVYLPGAGWIGMDSTSGMFAAEGHIPLVCTPNPSQAAPIGGTVEQAQVDFNFSVVVRRMEETASFSNPYSEDEWKAVRNVAHSIEIDLAAHDVRLTMGGEPTFVGIDEADSPEWRLEALGPLKRSIALELIRRLRDKTAPGGLLHFGQGKWYPGEPLPRWAFHSISRVDGIPVWENPDLIAVDDREYGFGTADAFGFANALARRLQVTSDNVLPAYDPHDLEPTSEPEPAGYILPLRRRQSGGITSWSSQLWFPRPERLVLTAGDSALGYRIPLAAIPWVAPDQIAYEYESSPFEDRVKIPDRPARSPHLFEKEPKPDPLPALSAHAETATELIRPSLCIQARHGRLHVFLPYVPVLADYLDLVAAVEDSCQHLQKPVWVEGYTPKPDPRVRSFSLTPDPGVLEVNLPPAGNWDELERINEILFKEALCHRLSASKFAFDGDHMATGGGSHIVIGGSTPMDSPFLRRPGLLRSMLLLWQNHPSLSYLFSGLYVGPTSQYPRVDEARSDALYELEVSFSQLPESGCEPWILDALFRNLLADVTGNTHRAEFCIDKLYPPDGAGLKLGLLELRAFEMAPHFRMGLMEMLLIRALVCMLWKQPFQGQIIRWGTSLHDRFLLPHFVQRDLSDVLALLRNAGYSFEDAWFGPHFEFRFPRIGAIASDGVELELRRALEPWNVLAEEATSGGTVRTVDSSLDRIQVRIAGLPTEPRYVVACNGRKVPLHPTGAPGEAVAAIRYRARMLSRTLRPTIPVHTPLTFDLIDTWKKRSVARCLYHSGKPNGDIYTSRPANSMEAMERRSERFVVADLPGLNSSGPISMPNEESNAIFPMTLDLRWPAPPKQASPVHTGLQEFFQ